MNSIVTPTVGSVQQIMPAAGVVAFTCNGEDWTLPLVGYAVVVRHVDDEYSARIEVETEVEPLFLDDEGCPTTPSAYQDGRRGLLEWRVVNR